MPLPYDETLNPKAFKAYEQAASHAQCSNAHKTNRAILVILDSEPCLLKLSNNVDP